MTLHEATSRVAAPSHALKIFVQENQSIEAFRPFLVQFERFWRELDAVIVSSRTEQSIIHDFKFFSLCMPLTVFHRLQAPRRIKVLLCPCANIVTLT